MNIVFDLGGVVITWQPEGILKTLIKEKDLQSKVRSEVFGHPDWALLDKGVFTLDQIVKRSSLRTGIEESLLYELIGKLHESIVPVEETVGIIKSLKRNGYKVFALTNLYEETYRLLKEKYSIFDLFDGIVISFKLKMVKPEPEIYLYLLDKYKLIAEETLFIDDREVNINTAAELGIKTIKFEKPGILKDQLKKYLM